jgi:alpha-tubulin suppressor-like RCC1 family protein
MANSRTSAAGAGPPRVRRRSLLRWLAVAVGALGLGAGVFIVATPALATASQWVAVSAGYSHTCAIKVDTTVWCWGGNRFGQLGTNDNVDRCSPAPVQSAGLNTGWSVVSAGGDFTCGIRSGIRYCWGLNSSGQLGLGDYSNRNIPYRRTGETSNWATVDAGQRHACGARTSGTGQCWGNNSNGQLGLGDYTNRNTAQIIGGSWTSISAGSYHTCGLDPDGRRLCWGRNNASQLGMDSISFFDQTTPYHDPGDGAYSVVEAGDGTTCSVRGGASRNLLCWGVNTYGNIGNGNTTPGAATISTLNWATTSSGGFHACAIRATGTIYCWGRNDAGQLGLGNNTDKLTETALPRSQQNPTWSTVTAGLRHTCGIRTDKTLYCWGYNFSGQLGVGSTVNKNTPTLVP